jgi:hypothetical protein
VSSSKEQNRENPAEYMVYALAAWAHDQGLEGQVTVLAIDRATPTQKSSAWGKCDLAFGAISIGI